MQNETVIPQAVIIESVFGCNASCMMCPIDKPTKRKKGIMPIDFYKHIIDELCTYKDEIRQLDLFGVGEPLLDKRLPEKIEYAKQKGFCGIGIATNADLMDKSFALHLFKAGIDTIMVSIDGATKAVHESIRTNTDFDRVVQNIENALVLRNENDYKTKFVIRFIRQPLNFHEWVSYHEYWSRKISKENGDVIIGYDIHSWGGEIDVCQRRDLESVPPEVACHHLFDRLIILQDGSIPLCCSDMHHAKYSLGNVRDGSPIDIFNNSAIQKIRKKHLNGTRLDMKICTDCTILESELAKEIA
jgi:radical SAM protein with 4Fe4S-binding SPASM domain